MLKATKLDKPQAGFRDYGTAAPHVAAFYRAVGLTLPKVPFLDVVTFRFGIDDPDAHYHLPMKVTPWGYSCFRGGA